MADHREKVVFYARSFLGPAGGFGEHLELEFPAVRPPVGESESADGDGDNHHHHADRADAPTGYRVPDLLPDIGRQVAAEDVMEPGGGKLAGGREKDGDHQAGGCDGPGDELEGRLGARRLREEAGAKPVPADGAVAEDRGDEDQRA